MNSLAAATSQPAPAKRSARAQDLGAAGHPKGTHPQVGLVPQECYHLVCGSWLVYLIQIWQCPHAGLEHTGRPGRVIKPTDKAVESGLAPTRRTAHYGSLGHALGPNAPPASQAQSQSQSLLLSMTCSTLHNTELPGSSQRYCDFQWPVTQLLNLQVVGEHNQHLDMERANTGPGGAPHALFTH